MEAPQGGRTEPEARIQVPAACASWRPSRAPILKASWDLQLAGSPRRKFNLMSTLRFFCYTSAFLLFSQSSVIANANHTARTDTW